MLGFDSIGKEYRYFIRRSTVKDPFTRHYQYHYGYSLDVDKMQRSSSLFIGYT